MVPTHLFFLLLSFPLWPLIFSAPGSPNPVVFTSLTPRDSTKKLIADSHGAIIRGDVSKKEIALVLTGDEFADGGKTIRETLGKHNIKAAFFLTGNFYSNPA